MLIHSIRNKTIALLGILAMMGLEGCHNSDDPNTPDSLLPGDVYLNLSLDVLDPLQDADTRALDEMNDDNYLEPTISEYEKMKTVRVIILRGQRTEDIPGVKDSTGYVEHNHLFYLYNGVVRYDNMRFKVRGGEKKKIFFIVNEDLVEDQNNNFNFDNIKVGKVYEGAPIEALTLSRQEGMPLIDNQEASTKKYYIPMSECFDIEVPTPKNPAENEIRMKDFFVTRAAVKFSFNFNFTNIGFLSVPDWYVKDLKVYSLADKEYFLPHDTEYNPVTDYNGLEGKVIMKYSIPKDIVQSPYTFLTDVDYSSEVQNFGPALYFPESAANTKYTVSMTIANRTTNEVIEFEPKELTNLPSLPRNTHVVVNISLDVTERILDASATVYPYTGVYLNPEFGFAKPQTDHLTVENVGENLFKATYLRDDKEIDKIDNDPINLIWVSEDPSKILLEPGDNDPDHPISPAESIEKPVTESIRIVPQGSSGTATVKVYSQTGLVATIDVTVK